MKPNLKRIKSPENIQKVKMRPCLVCKKRPVDAHHRKSVGAGGDDSMNNLMPLCRQHHTEIHTIGRDTFDKKYNLKLIKE